MFGLPEGACGIDLFAFSKPFRLFFLEHHNKSFQSKSFCFESARCGGEKPIVSDDRDIRRGGVGCWHLKLCIGAKQLRMQINQASDLKEMLSVLEAFDWGRLSLHLKPALIEAGG